MENWHWLVVLAWLWYAGWGLLLGALLVREYRGDPGPDPWPTMTRLALTWGAFTVWLFSPVLWPALVFWCLTGPRAADGE